MADTSQPRESLHTLLACDQILTNLQEAWTIHHARVRESTAARNDYPHSLITGAHNLAQALQILQNATNSTNERFMMLQAMGQTGPHTAKLDLTRVLDVYLQLHPATGTETLDWRVRIACADLEPALAFDVGRTTAQTEQLVADRINELVEAIDELLIRERDATWVKRIKHYPSYVKWRQAMALLILVDGDDDKPDVRAAKAVVAEMEAKGPAFQRFVSAVEKQDLLIRTLSKDIRTFFRCQVPGQTLIEDFFHPV